MSLLGNPMSRIESYLGGFIQSTTNRKTQIRPPSLTLSRQCGTGADSIVPKLADYLIAHGPDSPAGWAFFDKELVARIIADHKLPEVVGEFMVEDSKSPMEDAIEELLALHPSDWTLFQNTAETMRHLCHLGGAILVGRGGNFIAKDLANTFHVRLVGSEKVRQKRFAAREGLDEKKALHQLRETDAARLRYVKQHLAQDAAAEPGYHLILNTDQLNDDAAAEILGKAFGAWNEQRKSNVRDG